MAQIINAFPGYEYLWDAEAKKYRNMYRGEDLGHGGYIRSNPGIYGNVALLDIRSLHPTSAVNMNAFGEYTKNFKDLLDARVAIKQNDYETARSMLDGKLAKYLDDESTAKDLAQALKIAINSVYGLSAASFDNPFRDNRNKNNIIALRGALFMKTLQDEVEAKGYQIVAIKTDSIKIADATKEIIEFCIEFAKKYGYVFEFECFYDRICQINDADYIAKYKDPELCQEFFGYIPSDNKKHGGQWTATGAQFAVPYVFKTLFSKDPITFEDMCETKSVSKGMLYLDMNESLPNVEAQEKELDKVRKEIVKELSNDDTMTLPSSLTDREAQLVEEIEKGHNYIFVGRVGQFCPIKPGCHGGVLYRMNEGKYYGATGTKGYRWLESETVRTLGREDDIDRSYYNKLVNDAADNISFFGDLEWFVSDDPYIGPPYDEKGRPVYLDFGKVNETA